MHDWPELAVRALLKPLFTIVESPARLDRIVQVLTGLSRARVRGLFDHGCVRVNDIPQARGQLALQPGDRVSVQHDPHTRYHEKPKPRYDPAFRVLFEDAHVIVVNKAAHVLTVPTPGGRGKTLIDAVHRAVDRTRGSASSRGKHVHVVHRLDLGVSGVLVIAKTADAAERIRRQFASHKPERVYVAIVSGVMESKRGAFRSHLATDMMLNRYSTRKPGKGELAITHYEVVCAGRGATVVRVRLETGKRNQIRVHFAEAGHPVLGDPRYPRDGPLRKGMTPATSRHPHWKARRLALHAHTLAFDHPVTGRRLSFEAPVPVEFEPFMRRWKATHVVAGREG